MTDQPRQAAPDSQRGEGDFDIGEIFFSRTDERGVISAGNDVFRRVSGYEWGELVGRPHKVIRHPDTPKGVFHLFWEELKQGRSVSAYVLNRSKSGAPYWVFAIAAPIDGGYLSVRIKPCSDIFSAIQDEYADLLKREADERLTPEASDQALRARLEEMGYDNYGAFACAAAAAETMARNDALDRTSPAIITAHTKISEALDQMFRETRNLPEVLKQLQITQVNMGVLASRIETGGGPITAIATIYSQLTQEIGNWIDSFLNGSDNVFDHMRTAPRDASFMASTAQAQRDAVDDFASFDIADAPFDSGAEAKRLIALADETERAAAAKIGEVAAAVRRLSGTADSLKREVSRLGSTRMICEVESARLSKNSESLNEVVNRLTALQTELEQRQGRIENAAEAILKELAEVNADSRRNVAAPPTAGVSDELAAAPGESDDASVSSQAA